MEELEQATTTAVADLSHKDQESEDPAAFDENMKNRQWQEVNLQTSLRATQSQKKMTKRQEQPRLGVIGQARPGKPLLD